MTPEEKEGYRLATKASQGEWGIIGDWTGYLVLVGDDYSIEARGDDAFFIQHHNPAYMAALYDKIATLEYHVEQGGCTAKCPVKCTGGL